MTYRKRHIIVVNGVAITIVRGNQSPLWLRKKAQDAAKKRGTKKQHQTALEMWKP